ncbi:MAG: hypothetical protein CMJ83_12955 [Planctomycetes bacterium]|nr:hypothetical protein [Planctomycetota bacterium]
MTKIRSSLCGMVVLLVLVSGVVTGQDAATASATLDAPTSVNLEYRTFRKWKLTLPEEQWNPVGPGIHFATHGLKWPIAVRGTALQFDADLDGVMDVKIEGDQGLVTLSGKLASGQTWKYTVRVVNKGGWKFAPGGGVVGKIDGTKVTIVDQNGNGRYGDIGEDAMIVGRGKAACFLSKVVSVGGQAYEIDVASDGTSLSYRPYQGETGVLRLDMETKAKVLSAVVKSTDGQFSYELSRAGDGFTVPAGRYALYTGELGISSNRMRMKRGRSKPIIVEAKRELAVEWGGPVKAEFDYARQGGKVGLSPDKVWYYGAKGEEYTAFKPLGKSPKFTFTNRKTGREIATAYFPGTC